MKIRPRPALALLLLIAGATSGCYLEGTGGGHVAAGGVSGTGGVLGINAGVYLEAKVVKVAVAGTNRYSAVNASDGALNDNIRGGEARADVTFASVGEKEWPVFRATGVFGWGSSALSFQPKGYSQTFTGDGSTYSGFLGVSLDTYFLSLSVGPSIDHVDNGFVGNTTFFGAQARLGLWLPLLQWFLTAKNNPNATPPDTTPSVIDAPSKPLPDSTPLPDSDRYRRELEKRDNRRDDKCNAGTGAPC